MISVNSKGLLDLSKLHDNQKRFVKSQKLHTGVVGGYQSGKSVGAVVKAVTKLLINPQVPIAYYLPNYRLISDMLVPKFKSIFESLGIEYDHHKQDSKIITRYGEIWMRSMDNPDTIVSYSVGYSLIDEADLVHPNKREEVMQRITSRNSFKKDTYNSIDYVSTPEGFGEMHDFFVKKKDDETKLLLRLSTRDNEKNLGLGYIKGLEGRYTPEQLKAYLDGYFVNITSGSVFNYYDRIKNGSFRIIKDSDILHVGIDFNVGNMSAIIHVTDGQVKTAVAEHPAYDTRELCTKLKDYYPKHYIIAYPDASGKNRKTSGSATDIDIIKSFGISVKHLKSNPPVKDRINHMNNMFEKNLYQVNASTCPEYADNLEQLPYKDGVPDKTSGMDHRPDAAGYYLWWDKKSNFSIS